MSNNVISNQGEIKTVINEVNTKTQEVIAAIREYNWMLQRLQSLAIKDDLINAKLSGIALHLKDCRNDIIGIQEQISTTVSGNNETIANLDKGDFGDFVQDSMIAVENILNRIS